MQMNTANARLVFENAKALLAENGLDPSKAVLSQSYLRSEMILSTTVAKYHVPILVNDTFNGSQLITENRLNLQDVFITSSIALYIAAPASATDGAFTLKTYPNIAQFTAAGSVAALFGAYSNGNLSLIIDNKQVLPSWDLMRHLLVPQQQQAANPYYTTSAIPFADQLNGAEDAFYVTEPNFILSGNSKFSMDINLPVALAAVTANSRFIVVQRGLLAQNVTKLAN